MAQFLVQYQIFKGQDKQWYWRLIGPNGKNVAVAGEGFKRRAGAVNACKKMPTWSQSTVITEVVQ